MTFDNLGNEIPELVPSYILSLAVIPHDKNLMLKMYPFPKKTCKDPSSLTLLEVLRLNITWTEKTVQKAKNTFSNYHV